MPIQLDRAIGTDTSQGMILLADPAIARSLFAPPEACMDAHRKEGAEGRRQGGPPVPRWHADNARPGLLLLLRPGDGIALHESRLHGPLEHAGEPRPVPVDGGATERPPLWEESPNGAIPFSASEMVHNASLAPVPANVPIHCRIGTLARHLLDITCSLLTHAPFKALATERIIVMAPLQLVTFATAPPFL